MVGSTVLWIIALVLLLAFPVQWGLYVVFALMGLSQPGNMIGDLNLAMEFDHGPRRPSYIGLARTLTAPVLLGAPVLAGTMAGLTNYPGMFMLSLGFAVLALLMLVFVVIDPRKKSIHRSTQMPQI